jgi:DNA-binding transcriptional LysR family regulator
MITDESLIGAVSHDHSLAGTTGITVEEIEAYPLMCLPEGSGLRAAADAAWAAVGVKPRVAFEAGDPRVLAQLAARGLGVAILPERFVRSRPDELHPVEILSPHLRAGLALVRRSSGRISPAAGALLSHVRTVLA